MTSPSSSPPSFAALLASAVTEPGMLSAAYGQFHHYSIGNQLLAWSQCVARSIQPGPMATFQRWRELGRHVKKGEKAIVLCRPVTLKRTTPAADGTEETAGVTWFVYKALLFVLALTEGIAIPEPSTPSWSRERALATLTVSEVQFDLADGNCLGFARDRSIAINPINPMPYKTRFHELAHVLLGHTSEGTLNDGDSTPRNLRECEAEAVALLCCAALGLPGIECSRGYIQAYWGQGNPIPERSAQRVLKVADQILKAGTEEA